MKIAPIARRIASGCPALIPALVPTLVLALAVATTFVTGRPAMASTAGVTVSAVNLRSGPGTSYGVLTVVPAGAHVTLLGCTADVHWCSATFGAATGWLSAGYVQVTYQGQPKGVTPGTVALVGLGILTTAAILDDAHHDDYHHDDMYHDGGHHDEGWHPQGPGPAAPPPPAHAGRTVCGPDVCAHAGATRGPDGNVVIRRGAVQH